MLCKFFPENREKGFLQSLKISFTLCHGILLLPVPEIAVFLGHPDVHIGLLTRSFCTCENIGQSENSKVTLIGPKFECLS